MSSLFKSVLYRIIIISFTMLVINLIVGWIFDSIYPKPKNMDDLDTVFLQIKIQDYLQIFLLFFSAVLIVKKIPDLNYWKIALGLLGIIVLNYHLAYIYEVVDYYLIKGLTPSPEKNDLKSLLTLFSFEPTPPHYEPINHLTNWHLFYTFSGEISLGGFFYFVFYGSVSRVLWISAVVFFIQRKKKSKMKPIN